MRLFALNASNALGKALAARLDCELDAHEERDFSWGEHKARPLVDVNGEDAYVISSLHGDRELTVNDKICRLMFFIGALKDAGAASVTAIAPYLAYSRKDVRTKSRDPVTTRYLATALQSVGTDRVVTMDVHSIVAFENSFRCPTVNLEATELFVDYLYRSVGDKADSIVAPDHGAIKAGRVFADAYAEVSGRTLSFAVMDKRRSEGVVSGTGLIGAVGRHVLIVDDMIGSGTTLCRATDACLEAGADGVSVCATHGLFQEGAPALFAQPGIESIAVTDSVAIERLGLTDELLARIDSVETAGVLAKCIRELTGRNS
jgi:ribose-phosphate pyrophosphokinase